MQRRPEAEQQTGRDRERAGKREQTPIHQRDGERLQSDGHDPLDERRGQHRNRQTQHAAGDRQAQGFDEHLPRQPSTRGAERQAHRVLAAAHRCTGQEQAGEIGAGDEDDDCRGGHQCDHLDSGVAEHLFADRDDHGFAEIAIGLGILLAETFRNRLDVRVRRLNRHTGLQAGDHGQEMVAADGGLLGRELHRDPVVDIAGEEDERRWGHTDHLLVDVARSPSATLPGHRNRAPDNARIAAVAALPEGVTDHHDSLSDGVVCRCERAANDGLNAQHGEEVCRDATADHELRPTVAGEVREGKRGGRHVGERPVSSCASPGSWRERACFWGNPPRFGPPRP